MVKKVKRLRRLKNWWANRHDSFSEPKTASFVQTDYSISPPIKQETVNIVGLSVDEYGRMGNNLLQTSNALLLASSLRLPFVQLPETELVKIVTPTEVDGITFLPANYDTNKRGLFLKGTFYRGPRLERLGIRMPVRRKVLSKYLVPAAHLSIPQPEAPGCLTIHLRSGDAFDANPHPDFAQPPLAFYKLVIEDAREQLGVNRVRLVFEDRRNPCVGALQSYLESINLPLLLQSGSLQEDLDVLMSARHLTFGYGTFGVGVCLLSNSAETVNIFGASGPAYQQFDHLKSIKTWGDIGGRYPQVGDWRASPEQLSLMLTLPNSEIGPLSLSDLAKSRVPDWWTLPEQEL
ncbi:hypothetical protein HW561_04415 [Rhodobacteraceae bacterium B1Z28]|uniref:Capsular polysaccharide biosynthesis protein n=1 Tax=Ruegeria haliotis TaxID=2747601 RepID=A0ABX2PLN7_9RHOB|nr:hypothetical protein [Ruegeria haliotis]NVO55033.1 hypothetical protein [Ruegeria haliotis]